jgi:probable F420-dependent oxidoreductase
VAPRRAFRFGVSADRSDSRADWRALSRKVEDLGFATLTVPDHLGAQFAPIPALAAAASATTSLRLGTLVACNDYRHPVVHAKDLATLDVLTEGRVEWGIGAGWLAAEYESSGIPFDRGTVRLERLQEAVRVVKALFGPDPVTFDGRHYQVTALDGRPKPVQRPHPPLLIGGSLQRMLGFAAREADIVSVLPSLAGRMVDANAVLDTEDVAADRQIGWVREAAGDRLADVEINMVAFPAIVTKERERRAADVAPGIGLTPAGMLVSPHVWIGTIEQICDSLEERRERWGVSYWVVPATAVQAVAPVVARLAGR